MKQVTYISIFKNYIHVIFVVTMSLQNKYIHVSAVLILSIVKLKYVYLSMFLM